MPGAGLGGGELMGRELSKKERMALPRNEMPRQEAEVRAKNFEEVALGYSEDAAMDEAERCLECKKPKCIEGCPVAINMPTAIGRS